MWNTTIDNRVTKTEINSPATGIIQKSNPKSFFLRMQNGSELSKEIFSKNPEYKNVKVAVIQVLLMDKEWLLVELVDESEL